MKSIVTDNLSDVQKYDNSHTFKIQKFKWQSVLRIARKTSSILRFNLGDALIVQSLAIALMLSGVLENEFQRFAFGDFEKLISEEFLHNTVYHTRGSSVK